MKPLIIDGREFDKLYVEGLKEPLKAVRDVLLEQNKFNFALALSEIHAILTHYQSQLKD